MTAFLTAAAVIYDLEFTAWEGSMERRWMAPGEYKEVVQIGAVKVAADFTILESFDQLVLPRLNGELSPYFEKLTGITNERLAARGVDFAEAYEAFVRFTNGLPIVAFGRDDLVLRQNLRLYGLRNASPLPPYVDLRAWVGEVGLDASRMHSSDLGPAAGVAFEGHTHDAFCDARSLTAGLKAFTARGFKPPRLPTRAP